MHVGKVRCLTIKLSITAIIYAFIQNNILEKQIHICSFLQSSFLYASSFIPHKTCLYIPPDYIKLCNFISIFTCIPYKLITNKLYKTCYCHCIKHLYFHSTHFSEYYLTYLPFLIHTCSVVLAAGVFCATATKFHMIIIDIDIVGATFCIITMDKHICQYFP